MKQVQHNSGPGLVIGIPTLGRPVNLDWAMALKSLNPPINYNSVFQIVKGQAVDVARNSICKYAQDSSAKYIFFLGDDVIVPGYALRQLIFRMEQDPLLGAVGGVYCSKSDPPNPLVFRGNGRGCYWDWKVGEYFEVTGLGMDCTLIRTEALKDIPAPWFKTIESDQFLHGVANAESWTEDLWFFNQLATTPWKVYCDSFVMCGHLDVYADKVYTLPPDSLPMRRKVAGQKKKVLVIGDYSAEQLAAIEETYDATTFSNNDLCNPDYRGNYNRLPFMAGQFERVIPFGPGPYCEDEIKRVINSAQKDVPEVELV